MFIRTRAFYYCTDCGHESGFHSGGRCSGTYQGQPCTCKKFAMPDSGSYTTISDDGLGHVETSEEAA